MARVVSKGQFNHGRRFQGKSSIRRKHVLSVSSRFIPYHQRSVPSSLERSSVTRHLRIIRPGYLNYFRLPFISKGSSATSGLQRMDAYVSQCSGRHYRSAIRIGVGHRDHTVVSSRYLGSRQHAARGFSMT